MKLFTQFNNTRDRLALDPENPSKFLVEKSFVNSTLAVEFKSAFSGAKFKGEDLTVVLSCEASVRKL